jgi:hypothetical protein
MFFVGVDIDSKGLAGYIIPVENCNICRDCALSRSPKWQGRSFPGDDLSAEKEKREKAAAVQPQISAKLVMPESSS